MHLIRLLLKICKKNTLNLSVFFGDMMKQTIWKKLLFVEFTY